MDRGSVQAEVVTVVEADDVVEVPGAAALSHSADLLGEDLLQGVAANSGISGKLVGVSVRDGSSLRRPHDELVDCEVDLDACSHRGLARAPVVHTALGAHAAWSPSEPWLPDGEVDAGLVADPRQDLFDHRMDVGGIDGTVRQDGEVEVLGEPVGLDVALLQAGAAFEDPEVAELRMLTKAPEHPAEDVILLDDVLGQPPSRTRSTTSAWLIMGSLGRVEGDVDA